MKYIVADAGYNSPAICREVYVNNVTPVLPYMRPRTKKGFFKKYEYVYDEYYDVYICPNEKILPYKSTTRDGYREYKSNPKECVNCPLLNQCTGSKDHQKVVTQHIWNHYQQEVEHNRHTDFHKFLYSGRKETIERQFAEGKENFGMRFTRYRGIERVKDSMTLIFASMNLKKLALHG
jgi:hypothetical protein